MKKTENKTGGGSGAGADKRVGTVGAGVGADKRVGTVGAGAEADKRVGTVGAVGVGAAAERDAGGARVSLATMQRAPSYLRYLKGADAASGYVSSVEIAEFLGLNDMVVKKDLNLICPRGGKPRMGFAVDKLTAAIESFLGYDNATDAVLVGAGRLGRTLLCYEGFAGYGLNIVAAFDSASPPAGTEAGGKRIFGVDKLDGLVKRMRIRLGIITTPKDSAQSVCDGLVAAGVKAIWNFAPTNLKVPDGVALKNEDMAASLAVLSDMLKRTSDGR
ncbi:MAG: redox-sensing transcriptional repressor Rex [Clostridiales bacterium]|nr:redox-sensing transcriptional repressor Rex [Clostridiales bacterium]